MQLHYSTIEGRLIFQYTAEVQSEADKKEFFHEWPWQGQGDREFLVGRQRWQKTIV